MASSKTVINLQDVFLNQVRKEQVPVTIYLTNGVPLKGIVKGFDNYTIVLELEDKQQMLIFKSAVSSITPKKSIIFTQTDKQ
ncbi:MAG: RNA chaperone Hfq [Thermoanaerobacteraceae bacterium]